MRSGGAGTQRADAQEKRLTRAPLGAFRVAATRTTWLVFGVAIVAFALRAFTAQSAIVTTDEFNWMARSYRFHEALTSGDLASASATAMAPDAEATMPGVTTMWVGAVAQSLWSVGEDAGVVGGSADATYLTDPAGLDLAQTVMALAAAVALGLLTWFVALWAGRMVAAVAGLLLATEPFFVAHGAVLHTDELTALFGSAAFVATALALGVPRPTGWAGRWWAACLAGGLWGLALLTKLTALVFLPGVVLLGLWAVAAAVRRVWREGGDARAFGAAALGRAGRVTAWWVGAAAAVTFALYPALWVAPVGEYESLRQSMAMASSGHRQFFLGETVATPGPAFYGVVLPLRMTPWFLLATLVAAVAVWRRPTRRTGLAVACLGVPALVLLSLAGKQFDRYGLPILVACALVVGLAVDAAARAAVERWPERRRALAGTSAVAAVAVVAYAASVVPWGITFYNPALGGGQTALDTVLVGWWEGLEQAGPIIAERERGNCEDVTIRAPWAPLLFPCGTVGGGLDATYLVLYVSQWQRMPADAQRQAAGRELVASVRERGITLVEVYGPRHPAEGAATPR